MPYWHCTECHHEWEGSKKDDTCDWCGYPGYVLEEATPLELMLKDWFDPESDLRDRLLGITRSASKEGRRS
jgi:hypothetical protein